MSKLSIEFNEEKDIHIVHVSEDYCRRAEEVSAIQSVILKPCDKYSCRQVLIDFSQAEVSGDTMPIYQAGNPPPEVARELRKIRVAHLYREVSENERFFENVAVNRGFRVRVFDNSDEAVDWLVQRNNNL